MQLINTIRRRCVHEGVIIVSQKMDPQWWQFKVNTSNFSVPRNMPFNEPNVEAVMEQIRLANKDNV